MAALLIPVAAPGSAWAHGEESDQSAVLTEQAVALIANGAAEDQVAERIEDALMAPHKEGVTLAKVREAQALVERPGYSEATSRQVKVLLLASLGGKLPSAPQAGRPATAEETGTTVVLDELRLPRGISDGGDAVLVGLGAAALGGGLWLSHRLRPPHTIRRLEHRDRGHREAS
ncbi:hypothetical protein [Streptomyces albiflavescens]|nr:hypothetical protein [Streptomyces albiflavescens]